MDGDIGIFRRSGWGKHGRDLSLGSGLSLQGAAVLQRLVCCTMQPLVPSCSGGDFAGVPRWHAGAVGDKALCSVNRALARMNYISVINLSQAFLAFCVRRGKQRQHSGPSAANHGKFLHFPGLKYLKK